MGRLNTCFKSSFIFLLERQPLENQLDTVSKNENKSRHKECCSGQQLIMPMLCKLQRRTVCLTSQDSEKTEPILLSLLLLKSMQFLQINVNWTMPWLFNLIKYLLCVNHCSNREGKMRETKGKMWSLPSMDLQLVSGYLFFFFCCCS